MRRPWIFLVVIAAIIGAYVWVFVWTDNITPRAPTRPSAISNGETPAEPG